MRVLSVNVARPRVVNHSGKPVSTGIYKRPVRGPVMARTTNLDGDEQADLTVHGGVDKAVYGFPFEHYPFYRESLGLGELEAGQFGENLTTQGMLETALHVGDRFRIGEAVLEVSQPRSPCFKFALKMGTPKANRLMVDSGRTGFYFRVIEEGALGPGDVTRMTCDAQAPCIDALHKLMFLDGANARELARAIAHPALAAAWRDEFRRRLEKLTAT